MNRSGGGFGDSGGFGGQNRSDNSGGGFGGSSSGFGGGGGFGGNRDDSNSDNFEVNVNDFPEDADEQTIKDCINESWRPKFIKIIGSPPKFGFVKFNSQEELDKALQKGVEVNGQKLRAKSTAKSKLLLITFRYSF